MDILDTEELGQNITIDHVIDSHGHPAYRVCSGGMCRFAEDHYVAHMYAQHFGYKPQDS